LKIEKALLRHKHKINMANILICK